ncbi:MAG: cytochrome c peroxidase [Gammaproteobacteria bacterium]
MAAQPAYDWHLPRGFPIPAVPADNPMSNSKAALGRRLFFETRLSLTGKYSCASCHEPSRAFTDGRPLGIGATGQPTANNSMALVNVAYNTSYGWSKPEVRSLEQQMLEPLLNEHPIEVGLKGREREVATLLTNDADYHAAFAQAFPESNGEVTFDLMVKAIAAFERTLISGRSPFDRYVFEGQHDALNADAKRGMALFYSARLGCSGCHSGFNFAGNWRDAQGATGEPSFATNGLSSVAVRVPTLRNVAVTAPYMHDGSLSTLEAVVAHYESAGRRASTVTSEPANAKTGEKSSDAPRPGIRTFTLDATERDDLAAFLRSLTDTEFLAGFDEQRTHSLSGR